MLELRAADGPKASSGRHDPVTSVRNNGNNEYHDYPLQLDHLTHSPRQPPKCRTFPYLNLSVRPHSFAFRLIELEPAINHIQRAQTSLHPISPVPPGTAEQCHTHPFSLEVRGEWMDWMDGWIDGRMGKSSSFPGFLLFLLHYYYFV